MAISALELFWLPPTLMPLLSGCASFQIVSPAQDAITGNPTTVHVTAYPQINQLSVSLDQTNITNKILTNTTDGVGQVNVTPGPHTVAATAIVEPKILIPYNGTDSKQFCASQPRQAIKTVTPFAFASSNTWVNGTNGVSLGPDATDGSTRWWLADALPNSATESLGTDQVGQRPRLPVHRLRRHPATAQCAAGVLLRSDDWREHKPDTCPAEAAMGKPSCAISRQQKFLFFRKLCSEPVPERACRPAYARELRFIRQQPALDSPRQQDGHVQQRS